MNKLITRQLNSNGTHQQQYTIPPPHAHSLINKRDGALTSNGTTSTLTTVSQQSPMVVNTEIKVSDLPSDHLHHPNLTTFQQQTVQNHLHHSQQQQSQPQQQQFIHQPSLNGGSPISAYSTTDQHHGHPPSINGNNHINSSNKIISSTTTASTTTTNNNNPSNGLMASTTGTVEHEIKFTKTEGCTPSTCICVFIAILLISIGASSGIFYGLRSYEDALIKDQIFKGQFTVTRGDSYVPELAKRSSDEFKETSRKYKSRLDKLFSESGLAKAFRRSEILALERTPKARSDDLIVHYNLVFSPLLKPRLSPADVYSVLIEEVRGERKKSFQNVTIEANSIDISERKSDGHRRGLFYSSSSSFPASAQFLENPSPWEASPGFPGLLEGLTTEPTPPPRRCVPIELPFCNNLLNYNYTSYPNIAGHWNLTSLESDLIPYRSVVDSECYSLAQEFICQILQPQCREDEMIPPCREYCDDFMNSCKSWLVKSISDKIKCKQFPSSEEGHPSISSSSTQPTITTESSYNGSEVIFTHSSSHEKLASRLIGRTDEKRLQYKCRVKPGVTISQRLPGGAISRSTYETTSGTTTSESESASLQTSTASNFH